VTERTTEERLTRIESALNEVLVTDYFTAERETTYPNATFDDQGEAYHDGPHPPLGGFGAGLLKYLTKQLDQGLGSSRNDFVKAIFEQAERLKKRGLRIFNGS
jgi:hypothetical protein